MNTLSKTISSRSCRFRPSRSRYCARRRPDSRGCRRQINPKYLFLDVDGVLTNQFSFHANPESPISADCVQQLKRIVDTTKCKIVVSSAAWRCRQPENQPPWGGGCIQALERVLSEFGIKIYSCTPQRADGQRGLEILDWLKSHDAERAKYAVIDDETFDIDPYIHPNNIFKTGFVYGLDATIANMVIEHFTLK